MATTIQTEVFIAARPDQVWQVLTDFPSHAEWDPFFASIEGAAAVGNSLHIQFRQGMRMQPIVTLARPGEVFEWRGKLLFGGLFDGRHRFELRQQGGQTRFIHSESFDGILVPLLKKLLVNTERGFDAFNHALKQRVEAMP